MEQDHRQWQLHCFVLKLLSYILKPNFFSFLGSHYLQVHGVAMGTCCAPAYANLYLGEWERKIFSDESTSQYLDQASCWFRYIDDILMIWTGTVTSLEKCIEQLNINSYNIKFTFEWNKDNISF